MMAIVGCLVKEYLTQLFTEFCSRPENMNLKYNIPLRQRGELINSSSYGNGIYIEVWLEDKLTAQNQTINSVVSAAVQFERDSRKKTQRNIQFCQNAALVAV